MIVSWDEDPEVMNDSTYVFVGTSECLVCVGTFASPGEFSGEQDVGQFTLLVALQRAVRLSAEEQVVKVDMT